MELTCSAIQEALGIPEQYRKCTKGKVFQLAKISLVRAACPDSLRKRRFNMQLGVPIIVEKNREELGRVEATGYIPQAVIMAGAARRDYLLENGIIRAWAWVEKGCMEIQASEQISTDDLMKKLNEVLLSKMFAGRTNGLPGQQLPHITEIYPFQSSMVYDYSGRRYKQRFNLDDQAHVNFTGVSEPLTMEANNKDFMPPVQTGIRNSFAYTLGNNQSTNRGARNSELITQVIRNFSDINTAVQMYLDAVKNGLHKPMKPAFAPVNLTDAGKIQAALANRGIAPVDFAVWAVRALIQARTKKTKSHSGTDVPMSKHAYVGDPNDPSTWHLPIDEPGRAKNALARVNQTHGIPADKKPAVLSKIRRAADKFGVDVSEHPTSGQKKWAKKGKAA